VPGPHLRPLFQIAVERHRPAPPLEEADRAALEAEVEAGVQLVAFEPWVEHLAIAAPHLSQEEEVRPKLGAGAAAVLLPESVADVFDGVEAEAVHAGSLRPGELRVEEELRHLGALGAEVRQPAHAAGYVVCAALA